MSRIVDYFLAPSKSNLWLIITIVWAMYYPHFGLWSVLWYFLSAIPVSLAEMVWQEMNSATEME